MSSIAPNPKSIQQRPAPPISRQGVHPASNELGDGAWRFVSDSDFALLVAKKDEVGATAHAELAEQI
jgi:hypothetical protein